MDKFEPSTPFEGWLKAEVDSLRRDFANHLKHHEKLEERLLKWGVLICGISLFIGWVAHGFFIK